MYSQKNHPHDVCIQKCNFGITISKKNLLSFYLTYKIQSTVHNAKWLLSLFLNFSIFFSILEKKVYAAICPNLLIICT